MASGDMMKKYMVFLDEDGCAIDRPFRVNSQEEAMAAVDVAPHSSASQVVATKAALLAGGYELSEADFDEADFDGEVTLGVA